jgi:16S rRNA (uracil1498-N3)-methyltransferase
VTPAAIVEDQVVLGEAIAHQVCDVLRLRPGARVIVLDNSGWEYEVELTEIRREGARGRVCARRLAQTDPHLALTLYQAMLKGDRFEWVLQKGTELGVSAFVPMLTRRTVPSDVQRVEKKRPRWERIVREAAEQSHRARLPALAAPCSFSEACLGAAEAHEWAFLPWEAATEKSLSHVLHSRDHPPRDVALLIGPEGGFEEAEVALAREQGIEVLTLGPRILRAETAALAAVTIVLSELGEMGG